MSYVGNAYGGGSAEPYCAAKVCPLKICGADACVVKGCAGNAWNYVNVINKKENFPCCN